MTSSRTLSTHARPSWRRAQHGEDGGAGLLYGCCCCSAASRGRQRIIIGGGDADVLRRRNGDIFRATRRKRRPARRPRTRRAKINKRVAQQQLKRLCRWWPWSSATSSIVGTSAGIHVYGGTCPSAIDGLCRSHRRGGCTWRAAGRRWATRYSLARLAQHLPMLAQWRRIFSCLSSCR